MILKFTLAKIDLGKYRTFGKEKSQKSFLNWGAAFVSLDDHSVKWQCALYHH